MELSTSPIFQSAVYRAEAPQFLDETNRACDPHIQKAKDNIEALKNNAPFKRCFTDTEEYFYRKKTGNRVLKSTCGFCSYKNACWGDEIQYLPQQQSKALDPKFVWYTKITNPRVENEN